MKEPDSPTPSQASDVGSIPIARSITPVDAVGFTGFQLPRIAIKTGVLDADGRDFRLLRAFWTRDFASVCIRFAIGYSADVTSKIWTSVSMKFKNEGGQKLG
jgi:hypothetical protein